MRKMHEEKQKQIEEEHEKMRIHNTKEMLKAQRAEELRRLVEDMDKRLGLDKLTKSYNGDNIIDFNEFAKKHRK